MATLGQRATVYCDSWEEFDAAPGELGPDWKALRIGQVEITIYPPVRTRSQEAASRKNGGA